MRTNGGHRPLFTEVKMAALRLLARTKLSAIILRPLERPATIDKAAPIVLQVISPVHVRFSFLIKLLMAGRRALSRFHHGYLAGGLTKGHAPGEVTYFINEVVSFHFIVTSRPFFFASLSRLHDWGERIFAMCRSLGWEQSCDEVKRDRA